MTSTLKIWLLTGVFIMALIGLWKIKEDALDRERGRRVAAEQSAALAKDTTRIIEKTMTRENTIYRQADEGSNEIQQQPGAEAPIPPELLSEWGRRVSELYAPAPVPGDRRP